MMDDRTLKRFLTKVRVVAHRLSYEHHVGQIPPTQELDHLCRTVLCVNPLHLEPVSHVENVHRGRGNQHVGTTHCKNGHEFTPENIYINPARPTVRQCRTCRREYMRRWKEFNVRR